MRIHVSAKMPWFLKDDELTRGEYVVWKDSFKA